MNHRGITVTLAAAFILLCTLAALILIVTAK